jgi:hypothetical protein
MLQVKQNQPVLTTVESVKIRTDSQFVFVHLMLESGILAVLPGIYTGHAKLMLAYFHQRCSSTSDSC